MENAVPRRSESVRGILSGFPPLFDDESVWSGCARYVERMGLPNSQAFMRELFGVHRQTWATDLPVGISALNAVLPSGYPATADGLMDDHTAYRYYAPFLPGVRATGLRDVIYMGGKRLRQLLACRRTSLSLPEFLRYCPTCAAEERRQIGECYWHRLHQLPGVDVCPTHEVWLETSQKFAWDVGDDAPFVSAERVVPHGTPRLVSERTVERDTLLWLARESAWLLTHSVPLKGSESLHSVYRYLLAERGWGTYRKRLAWAPFWKAFLKSCPMSILTRLEGHSKPLSSGNGIRALLRRPTRASPPLFHLLLIRFLGITVEQFVRCSSEVECFGSGPWPCLNPVAPHRNERAVVQCEVRVRRQDGRPIGTFICGCGFAYRRVGPDWGPLAVYQYDGIEQYGLYWEWMLRQLWRDPQLSREVVAERLGVSRVTAWDQARRLGLLNSLSVRPSRRTRPVAAGPSSVLIRANRAQWCRVNAMKRRTAAQRRTYHRLYAWLFRWDVAWLRGQRGERARPRVKHVSKPRLNWQARDRELARVVTRTAAFAQAECACPRRLSKCRLIAFSGHGRWIWPHWDRLPMTREAVTKMVEPRDKYGERREQRNTQRGQQGELLRTGVQARYDAKRVCATDNVAPSEGQRGLFEGE